MGTCSSRIDPEQAREIIDTLLDEDAEKLLALLLDLVGMALDNHRVGVARLFFIERPDGNFEFSSLGEFLVEQNRFDLLWKSVHLVLADIRREVHRPQCAMEVKHAKEN